MMKHFSKRNLLSFILCIVLIAALALTTTGCNDNASVSTGDTATMTDGATMGQGEKEFTFTAVDLNGKETTVTIQTNKATVGEALQELGLLEGEMGEYGLYVKTVNGLTLDYDTDGKYWAFYMDGEYSLTGVDVTDITPGASYAFKPE